MDSEHLREAIRAEVPRQLKANNFYILMETVRRRVHVRARIQCRGTPAWVMNAFPKFIPAKDVLDIDNAIDLVVEENERIDECNTFHSWLLRRDIPLFTTVTLHVH
jgi:hypothetical protein